MDFGIAKAQPFRLAQNEINFISDFEHRSKLCEVIGCLLLIPPGAMDKPAYELLLLGEEIDHAAMIVADQREISYATDCNCERDFEFTVT